MPRVSRARLQQKQLQDLSQTFASFLSSFHSSSDIEKFLYEFLTKEEKIMLSKRLMLFLMISQGYNPPLIQTALRISYETVRTYHHAYSMRSDFFLSMLRQLHRKKNMQIFFTKLEHLITTIATSKSNMRSRSKLFSEIWE